MLVMAFGALGLFGSMVLVLLGILTLPQNELVVLLGAALAIDPHADRAVRRMLLDEDPGTAGQYPCAIGVAYLGTQARPGLVTPPFALKREGRHWYVISFAGFNWIFLGSNDME